jgi:Flp pilus assembly protein TadD
MLIGNSIALFKVDEQNLAGIGKSPTKTENERLMEIGLDLLYKQKNYTGAAEQFAKVLAKNPDHYGATFQYAMALDHAGRKDEARPVWLKALEMAKAYNDTGTVEAALKQLQKNP